MSQPSKRKSGSLAAAAKVIGTALLCVAGAIIVVPVCAGALAAWAAGALFDALRTRRNGAPGV